MELMELASVLQRNLQHGCVAEKSATRMHLVQTHKFLCERLQHGCVVKNLQHGCVAEPETCTETPGTCTKIPVQIYIRADTTGKENKIQSRHISTDTACLLRSDKKNSRARMPQQKYSINEWGEVGKDNDHDDFDDYDDGRKRGRGDSGRTRRTCWCCNGGRVCAQFREWQ